MVAALKVPLGIRGADGTPFIVLELVDPSTIASSANPLVGANPADTTQVDATKTETIAATLAWFQGGTVLAPTPFRSWSVQPRDSSKAAFIGFVAGASFSGVWDTTYAQGYNSDLGDAAEPAIYDVIEQDFLVAPGVHWFEKYTEYFGTNRAHTFRPIYINVDRATDIGQLIFAMPGVGAAGVIQVTSSDGATSFLQLNVNGAFFKNNWPIYQFDADGVTQRNIATLTAGGYLVYGDFALTNSTIIRGGAGSGGLAGLILEGGPTQWIDFYDAANGEQFKFRLDPQPGGEISLTMAGPSPTVPGTPASGFVLYVDPGDGVLKAKGSSGTVTPLAVP